MPVEAYKYSKNIPPVCCGPVKRCRRATVALPKFHERFNVSEQPVFWLGGKPGGAQKKASRDAEALQAEPAVTSACKACGFSVDEYIAAQGSYGGWLIHLQRDNARYRLFWSGKTSEIRLDKAVSSTWQEVAGQELPDEGPAIFGDAVVKLLAQA